MAIVVCNVIKTKICTRLLLISNLSIQYSDFAIPMDIQKRMLIVLLCFICSYKKVKKKLGHLDFVGFEPIT